MSSWPLLLLLLLAACGRLSYAEQSLSALDGGAEQNDGTAHTGDDAQSGGGPLDDGASGDGVDAGADDDGEDAAMALPDAATPDSAPDAGGDVPPLSDASVVDASPIPPPDEDAGSRDGDAGSTVEPFPLPTAISCANVPGVLVCDSFSGSSTGPQVSTVLEGDGQLTTVNGFVTATAHTTSSRAVVQALFSAPITSGPVYMRFSMYVPSQVNILGLNVANLGNPERELDFGLDLNFVEGGVVQVYGASGDYRVDAPTSYVLPRDRWLCMRLDITSVGNTGAFRVTIDGEQVVAASGLDTLPSGGVTGAAVGVDWTFDGQRDVTLYIANLLLATSDPGPCP